MKRSVATSWRMSSIGNSGARSSGPIGWSVPGCSGGGCGEGRSGTTLYHWRGISDSSRVILVRSSTTASSCEYLSRTLSPEQPQRHPRTPALTGHVEGALDRPALASSLRHSLHAAGLHEPPVDVHEVAGIARYPQTGKTRRFIAR